MTEEKCDGTCFTSEDLKKTLIRLEQDLEGLNLKVAQAKNEVGKLEISRQQVSAQIGLVEQMIDGSVHAILKTEEKEEMPVEGQEAV